MRAGGMELIARETIETAGGPAQLIGARAAENGVAMRKWALLTRTDDMTAIVVAALPETAKDAYPDAVLRAALGSTFIRTKLSPDDMIAVLPYRLGDLGGFRLLRASPDGTAVFTLRPERHDAARSSSLTSSIAPRAVEPPQPSERDNFARRALATFINRPDLRIVASEQIRIGGQQGHEIVAESEDDRTKDPLMMVQWLRFGSGGLVQMFGIARKDQWAGVCRACGHCGTASSQNKFTAFPKTKTPAEAGVLVICASSSARQLLLDRRLLLCGSGAAPACCRSEPRRLPSCTRPGTPPDCPACIPWSGRCSAGRQRRPEQPRRSSRQPARA